MLLIHRAKIVGYAGRLCKRSRCLNSPASGQRQAGFALLRLPAHFGR